jgi:hypothetical protein
LRSSTQESPKEGQEKRKSARLGGLPRSLV